MPGASIVTNLMRRRNLLSGDGGDADHGDDDGHGSHEQVMEDLYALALIWVGVLVCNLVAKKTGATAIVLHLILGCIYVNTGLLDEQPSDFMLTFSELAITIVMFSLGLEEDVKNFMVGIKQAWGIALIGAIGPFINGYSMAWLFYQDQTTALMAGLCMTATAVSISLVTLKGAGMSTSKAATGIMTSAVLDDIGCLALVAIMVPILTSSDAVNTVDVVLVVVKAISFFVAVALICKFLLPERVRLNFCGRPDEFVYKWGYRQMIRIDKTQSVLVVLLTGLLFGLFAAALGFHPGIGAYMGALILKGDYFVDDHHAEKLPLEEADNIDRDHLFDLLDENHDGQLTREEVVHQAPQLEMTPEEAEALFKKLDSAEHGYLTRSEFKEHKEELSHGLLVSLHSLHAEHAHDPDDFEAVLHNVDLLAMTWLGPVFFVLLGTRMVFVGNMEIVVSCLPQVACNYVGMLVLQFFSASTAARYVPGGFNFVESVMVGFGMLGRAELAFVVLDIAYVQNDIFSMQCFYMLLFTCFCLNITAPILIVWWKPYYMGDKVLPFCQPEQGWERGRRESIFASTYNLEESTSRKTSLVPTSVRYLPEGHAEAAHPSQTTSHDDVGTAVGRRRNRLINAHKTEAKAAKAAKFTVPKAVSVPTAHVASLETL